MVAYFMQRDTIVAKCLMVLKLGLVGYLLVEDIVKLNVVFMNI